MSALTEHTVSTIILLSGWLRQKWALGNQNGEWIFFQCSLVERLCRSSRIFLNPVSEHRGPPKARVLTGHWYGRGMGWPGPVQPGPGPLALSAPRWWLFRSCLAMAQRCNYTWTRQLGGSEGGTSRKGFSPDLFSCYTRYWSGCCRWPGAVAAEVLSWGSYQPRNCWIWCLRSEKGKQGVITTWERLTACQHRSNKTIQDIQLSPSPIMQGPRPGEVRLIYVTQPSAIR